MKQKLFKGFMLATLVFCTSFLFGQSADEIIAKHIQAHGGQENWDAIRSIKISGQFTSYSEVKPYTEIKARTGQYFADFHKGQFRVQEGTDGTTYWVKNPWFELGFPHLANMPEKVVILQKAEFCTPFFNYPEKGYSVTYEGIQEVEGKQCHKLVLIRNDGQTETWFLDTDTYLEVMSQSLWADFASPSMQDVFYDDFRKVGEVILPFYTERVFSIRNRVLEIESVEFNINPDPTIFDFPLSPEMQKLKHLAGQWDVVLESQGRSGSLQFADSTSAVIEFVDQKNLLQEKINFVNYFPIEKINTWTYNTDLGAYLFSSFNGFYSNTELFQGNFEGDSLRVDNTQIRFNEDEQSNFVRIVLKNMDENSFVINRARSNDGGETWTVAQRFTYTRKKE